MSTTEIRQMSPSSGLVSAIQTSPLSASFIQPPPALDGEDDPSLCRRLTVFRGSALGNGQIIVIDSSCTSCVTSSEEQTMSPLVQLRFTVSLYSLKGL
jgi:hypothetical protein